VTEQWSTVAVAGPRSRDVIAKVAPDLDVSNEAFEFMGFRETTLECGIPARICRISFSGELAFEINVDAFYGLAVWEAVAAAGAEFDITPLRHGRPCTCCGRRRASSSSARTPTGP
jgi:sarcosine oxidase subunit alpha